MSKIKVPTGPGMMEASYANGFFKLATINHVLSINKQIAPVKAASTVSLNAIYDNGDNGIGATLSNNGTQAALMLDDVSLAINDLVLIKDQTNKIQNGIYKVTNFGSFNTNWVLTRLDTYDMVKRIRAGDVVPVVNGTVNKVSFFMLTTTVSTIGISDFVYAKISENALTAISGTTNQINVNIVDGVPTISLANNPILPGTGGVTIPSGLISERPENALPGTIRFCTDLEDEEY